MEYQLVVLPKAEADLARLSPDVMTTIMRRLDWLRRNATNVVHYRLHNLPDDLAGLCRIRHGDYRILYWISPSDHAIHVYHIRHRSEIYRDL